ncbi:MAG: hypothetical protein ABSE15_00300 [Candidatus Bathyarchaeia archaeon]|jgi:hypothetical protein
MGRKYRLIILFIVALLGSILAILLANSYITTNADLTAKGAIAASVVTLFGVTFSAFYKELSAYYKERSRSISKKWKLIFPFIKDYYNPWVGSAKSWLNAIEQLKDNGSNQIVLTRVLYLTTLFYGLRIRLIRNNGGVLLLSSSKDEDNVSDAYDKLKEEFQWAESETTKRVSYLQDFFLSHDKKDAPLLFDAFYNEVEKNDNLKECRNKLGQWLTQKNNAETLTTNVEAFYTCFKGAINKLYTAWSD